MRHTWSTLVHPSQCTHIFYKSTFPSTDAWTFLLGSKREYTTSQTLSHAHTCMRAHKLFHGFPEGDSVACRQVLMHRENEPVINERESP